MTPSRVAIVAIRPASGETGGAERAYQGLHDAFRAHGVDAELVQVVTDESTLVGVVEGYARLADLDLSSYAGVVTTKAPAYVIRHPNHVVFLLHPIRAFYDMWEQLEARTELLGRVREQVLRLDREALARARALLAIGVEVAERLEAHLGLRAEVLRPPSNLTSLRDGPFEHLLVPGRLHRWKRVDLVIAGFRRTRVPLRLRITGRGAEEETLRELAAGDERISFEGWVDDAGLVELYAQALAVAFTPVREDLGYVTLEAFGSGKPVITCHDSGEPTRLVRDGVSGIVCAPDPEAIAAAIERLWRDPSRAAAMGRQGRDDVRQITWEAVVHRLCDALGMTAPSEPRLREPSSLNRPSPGTPLA
jgi:glycosyltransferase involved in cell wall biosynthesis